MANFILFLFADFEGQKEIEFFCSEIFGMNQYLTSLKYIIDTNCKNIVVLFESDADYEELCDSLNVVLVTENVKFYFLFEKESMVAAHLPQKVKEFMFNSFSENIMMILDFKPDPPILELDELLEKIEKGGIDSLTPEEKKFLDNFEN